MRSRNRRASGATTVGGRSSATITKEVSDGASEHGDATISIDVNNVVVTEAVAADVPDVSTDATGTVSIDLEMDVAEAAEDPRMREPVRVENRRDARFSPIELYSLTRVLRPDIDSSDPDLFLVEEQIDAVPRDGVVLGELRYTGAGLIPHTAKRADKKRNYVIRYNRALRARGVLEEIDLGFRDPEGRYHFLAKLYRLDPGSSAERALDIVRQRELHVRLLRDEIARNEALNVEIQSGSAAVAQLAEERVARTRLPKSRRKQQPSFVATPEVGPTKETPGQQRTKRIAEGLRQVKEATGAAHAADDQAAPHDANAITGKKAAKSKSRNTKVQSPRRAGRGRPGRVSSTKKTSATPAPAANASDRIDSREERSADRGAPSRRPSVGKRLALINKQ